MGRVKWLRVGKFLRSGRMQLSSQPESLAKRIGRQIQAFPAALCSFTLEGLGRNRKILNELRTLIKRTKKEIS